MKWIIHHVKGNEILCQKMVSLFVHNFLFCRSVLPLERCVVSISLERSANKIEQGQSGTGAVVLPVVGLDQPKIVSYLK